MPSNRAAKRARQGEIYANTLTALAERRGWTDRKYGLNKIAWLSEKERILAARVNRLSRESRRPDLFPNAMNELAEAMKALAAIPTTESPNAPRKDA